MSKYLLLLIGIILLVLSFSLSTTSQPLIKMVSGCLGGFLLGEFTVAIFKKDE